MLFLKSSTKTRATSVVTNDSLKTNNAVAEHPVALTLFCVRCKSATEAQCPVFETFCSQVRVSRDFD